MQSVQRRFGKLLPRTADEAQVGVLLKDFDDADKMLAKLIDASKAWRDSWRDILTTQQRLVNSFQVIYEPLIGSDDSSTVHEHVVTPSSRTERTAKLSQGYEELTTDLLEEVNMADARIIKPAIEARDWIQPLKKVIKKREDRKLDFEKYQTRVDNASKKTKRSERDNANLAKAEAELYHAKEEYAIADDHLKSKLPPVVTAAFSLLPHLLSSQIMTQNSLLGNYYTMLHDYCGDQGFPSPPPPMGEVIGAWEADHKPVQREIERFACIAGGKAVRQSLKTDIQTQSNGTNGRNGYMQRKSSSQSTHSIQSYHSASFKPPASPAISATSDSPSPDPHTRPRISSVPSQTSLSLATPNYTSSAVASPSPGDMLAIHAPAGPRADYFTRDRLPSSSMASVAKKKPPPPPPPPKRLPSSQGSWVTALYDFAGQGQGDLAFREGDRIKIVQKTDSTDEWWEGELKGVQVFDLPHELLLTLHLKTDKAAQHPDRSVSSEDDRQRISRDGAANENESAKPSTSCLLCGASFANFQEQRQHIRSDWHGYNLKQKLKGMKSVDDVEFDQMIEDLDESISGSETSQSDNDDEQKESTLSALLKKQAKISHPGQDLEDHAPRKRKRGSGKPPLLWFSSPLLPSNTSLGVYGALFTEAEQEDESRIPEILRKKQLTPAAPKAPPDGSNGVPLPSTMTSPQIFLCMIGGGHFAAMIVSLAPKMNKRPGGGEERQATVIAHKTFHRYTTRRKQGGAQSANDSAKGAAHSAGASIRRYNEMALESEIRALLSEWKDLIDRSHFIFARATGSSNRRTIFGPYEGQVLRHNDPRNRGFPFSTRRATQAELMRAFVELTRVKVSEVDEAALAAAATAEAEHEASNAKSTSMPTKPTPAKPSKEEEAALHHTSQLQALIRRNKAPAVLSYLSNNSLDPNFLFQPEELNAHAPTPLFFAASKSAGAVVLALLTKAGADPVGFNGDDKVPFNLAGDRATRDAFRVARHELGEDRWDWSKAQCASALSKAEAEQREERAKGEEEKAEAERRKAETERLQRESAEEARKDEGRKMTGRALGASEKTGAEKREQEARGMTPEMRTRLERERRARAAEERMRRMAGGGGNK